MSNIDPSKPEERLATTSSVRDNFAAAAAEIDANVAAIAQNAADISVNSGLISDNAAAAAAAQATADTALANAATADGKAVAAQAAADAAQISADAAQGTADTALANAATAQAAAVAAQGTADTALARANDTVPQSAGGQFNGSVFMATSPTDITALQRKDQIDAAIAAAIAAIPSPAYVSCWAMFTKVPAKLFGNTSGPQLTAVHGALAGEYTITCNTDMNGGNFVVAATISGTDGGLSIRAFEKTPTTFRVQIFDQGAAQIDGQFDVLVTWE